MDTISSLFPEQTKEGLVTIISEDPGSAGFPIWSLWFSTVVLAITFAVGLPLNALTVLIFVRRKKLRHLVNFLLLLDCLSHIALTFICIPIQLLAVWNGLYLMDPPSTDWLGLQTVQQVTTNFTNLYGTSITLSIAVLRYRRLCWKKKDKFSPLNGLKWGGWSGMVALGLTVTQAWTSLQLKYADLGAQVTDSALMETQKLSFLLFAVKAVFILLAMLVIVFSYVRVSQRVWANGTRPEKVMDPSKLRKSRSVHLRATIHSLVQILLILLTLSPHLGEEALAAFHSKPGPGSPGPANSSTSPSRDLQGPLSPTLRLLGLSLNYALIVLGTPLAYIASCHRFREQFAALLFGQLSFSRQLLQKLSPSGGTGRGGPGTTPPPHRHLVMNHNNNNNKIGHRLLKPRNGTVPLSGGRSPSTRSSSVNSSTTSGSARLGFRAPRHLSGTVTKSTADIISTLTLHQFGGKLLLQPRTGSSGGSSPSGSSQFVARPGHASRRLSTEAPRLITYNYSPRGSMAEICGQNV